MTIFARTNTGLVRLDAVNEVRWHSADELRLEGGPQPRFATIKIPDTRKAPRELWTLGHALRSICVDIKP